MIVLPGRADMSDTVTDTRKKNMLPFVLLRLVAPRSRSMSVEKGTTIELSRNGNGPGERRESRAWITVQK